MLHSLVQRGTIPRALLDVALQKAPPELLTADPDQPPGAAMREFTDLLIVAFPRSILAPGASEWEDVSMTLADMDTTDPRDIDAIEDLVLRLRTPEQVTAHSRKTLGLPDEPDHGEEVAVPDLAEFRGEHAGPPGGDDGEAVADPPVAAAAAGG